MSEIENKLPNSLVTTIKFEDPVDLVICLERHLHFFKFDIGNIIKQINTENIDETLWHLRSLASRLDLLLRLADFVDYTQVLHGEIKMT